MATTPLQPIVSAISLTTSFQDIYIVPSSLGGAGIDSAVFNNYSSSTESYTVRLIQSGASTELNEIITSKDIRAFRNDLAPSMIGQGLLPGGTIQAKASANNSINVNITATLVNL